MKKKLYSMITLALAASAVAVIPAFASISGQEAEQIVKNEYPGATIYKVERDYEHGRQVYEVDFSTDAIWDGDVVIDAETGAIVERDIDYRDHGHHRRHH